MKPGPLLRSASHERPSYAVSRELSSQQRNAISPEGCAVSILHEGLDFRDTKNCSNARVVASRRTAELEELMNV